MALLKILVIATFALVVGFLVVQGVATILGTTVLSILLSILISGIVGYSIGYTGGKLLK